ncbi:hypothetical protein [Haloferula sp. A504]|uniref:hypothetical protein n=1 Tax=Haloferula sp. A504 TaxID=3373601 RepID=UPI0031C20FA3|nr:hypothetical protein [Verrucomicrobiaceae bacterium E54]
MEIFHTLVTSIALLLLLLAVLRHRQAPLPLALRIGTILAPCGEIFAIAEALLGPEAINALLAGEYSLNETGSTIQINNTEVSHTYFAVMQIFHLITTGGMFLIAVGMLILVRRFIRQMHPLPGQA